MNMPAINTLNIIDATALIPLHDRIIAGLFDELDTPDTKKSHFFHGRFENIYIAANKIDSLEQVLSFILNQAAALLDTTPQALSVGYWFNLMQQGDITTAHCHDDHDELLSGTYYLQMPPSSGKLIIQPPQQAPCTIEPVEGRLVFFHPAVVHEVTEHENTTARISLGFNIGLKHAC